MAQPMIHNSLLNEHPSFDPENGPNFNVELPPRKWDDSPSSEEELRDDFNAADKDGDGLVSEVRIMRALYIPLID